MEYLKNVFKNPILVALIAAFVLTSGLVDINFHHNVVPPKELLNNKNTVEISTNYTFVPPFVGKKYDIYLASSLKDHKQMESVFKILNEATVLDKVVLHIGGFGGSVEVVARIVGAMQSSKASVQTVVESPAYSGHAMIALAVPDVQIRDYAYVMLHTSSGVDIDCSKETGNDRGIPRILKCEDFKSSHLFMTNKIIDSLFYVKEVEKFLIKRGYDLYIHPNTLRDRMP